MKRLNIMLIFNILLAYTFSLPVNAQDYLIGPDDVLKIIVYREVELNRKVRVSSDGYVSLPLIGKVKAVGKSVTRLELFIEKKLKRYIKKPHVTIFIEEFSAITVTGQVKKPGSYPLKRGLGVLEAISLAGGFTKIAAQNKVKVLRKENGKEKIIRVRVEDISDKDEEAKDVLLKRGDVVIVPESLF